MKDDFKKAVTVLLPVDPFVKNTANTKSVSFQVSALRKLNSFGMGEQTGVDLRQHKPEEYAKLKPEEKLERGAWQRTNEGMKSMASQRNTSQGSRKRYQENNNTPNNRKKARALRKLTKQSAEIVAT